MEFKLIRRFHGLSDEARDFVIDVTTASVVSCFDGLTETAGLVYTVEKLLVNPRRYFVVICEPRASLFGRFAYTNVYGTGFVKYGKLATKHPLMYAYFLQRITKLDNA